MQSLQGRSVADGVRAENIIVSSAMIEAGLAVLEETDDRPLSRATVERAFQAMCLCGLQESAPESSGL
ncbi:hypothetical protein D3C77_367010 [compost metagenome]